MTFARDGVLQGFEGMFEDITERRVLRDQLLQSQKLESVGQLDKHEGSIDFESVIGEGTTFIIRLPYQEMASLAELAAP